MLTLEQAIRKRILNLANERNLTINKISMLSGMPHTTLLLFMNNETHDPRISTILHICEAFDIDLKEFFNSPVFNNVIDE